MSDYNAVLTYPEGLPAQLPESQVVQPDANLIDTQKMNIVRRFHNMIPTNLISDGRLSTTSNPKDCFVYRRNSRQMQELMVDYAYNVVRAFNLTQEV
ncbi:hypothetical protein Arash_gp9 [Salmonella phage Arash]|jgi:hypothetical protein|nr:hypothetical protein [Salmonella enterica subsp. enterica serovar Enteritidis]WGL32460.1 hypothetical protein Arash_gp9 [Salmonella phage Arash]